MTAKPLSTSAMNKFSELILKRHPRQPSKEIYHYPWNSYLKKILQDNRLKIGILSGSCSFSANPLWPKIWLIPPEITYPPRKHKIVLNFKKLKEVYSLALFPVYYYVPNELHTPNGLRTTPPTWLQTFYAQCFNSLSKPNPVYWPIFLNAWLNMLEIYMPQNHREESEWKICTSIDNLVDFVLRIEKRSNACELRRSLEAFSWRVLSQIERLTHRALFEGLVTRCYVSIEYYNSYVGRK